MALLPASLPLFLVGGLVALVAFESVDPPPRPITVLVPDPCACTYRLQIEPDGGQCFLVSLTPGIIPNGQEPKCNTVPNCLVHKACDAPAGSATVTYAGPSPTCICNAPIKVYSKDKDDDEFTYIGSFSHTVPGAGVTVPNIGGDEVPCTDVDNTEGNGDTILVCCDTYYGGSHCEEFVIKDECEACTGGS